MYKIYTETTTENTFSQDSLVSQLDIGKPC